MDVSQLCQRLTDGPPPRVAVVGSINVDVVVRAERRPRAGETLVGHGFDLFPGGKGANQAVAAARLGGQVRLVGRVGQDLFAHLALEGLARAGVALDDVARDAEQGTGMASIVVDGQGENAIVVVPRANGTWSEADIARAEQAVAGAQVALLQLEVPLEVVVRAAHAARRAGARVVLNPAPARPLPPALLAEVHVLTPNAREAAALAGAAGSDLDPEAAARLLQQQGPWAVAITLGERGAFWLEDDRSDHVAGFSVAVADTTAAGDAFNGALAVALARGLELAHAVRVGCAAGALAATRLGAQPSLPTLDEVCTLLRR
ncbi:MAG: ribokinase [Chloroflexi bacterium]|nr:ribokinase [Chloroflexota bacterium]